MIAGRGASLGVGRSTLLVLVLFILACLVLLPQSPLRDPTADTLRRYKTSLGFSSGRTVASVKPFSTFLHDPDHRLAYRNHLELTTSPASQITHSPTLTFSHIYVLSLPTRLDRREEIGKLAKALGIEATFVDAAFKTEPFITWIAERAVEVRREKIRLTAKVRHVRPSSIGGLEVGNVWLAQSLDTKGLVPYPPINDPSYPRGWVQHLEEHAAASHLDRLVPANPNLNISRVLWDRNEKIAGRQVNEGVISTFFGHTRAIKMMIENGDESALILEDDVDIEWDIERMWSRIHRRLPSDWDVSFLGHCWGQELLKPQYLHPLLHQSTAPLCLHAYALSAAGAKKALKLLNNPWTAYQTAVDTALPSFIRFGLLKSFSVDPPLIIQRKQGASDIQPGIGSKWRGVLMDSTVERIARDEGQMVVEDVWDPHPDDPALVFKYSWKCHK